MDPLTMMAIGSGLGLAKSEIFDKPKEKRQRELAAKTQELSPWTGIAANKIEEADPFGSALKYGATGASMGRQANYDAALMKALDRSGGVNTKPQPQIVDVKNENMMNPLNGYSSPNQNMWDLAINNYGRA